MAATRLPGTPRLLRALNDRAALELLLARGPLTRAQLGEMTGLSKVTASQLVERLEERGLVRRVGEQAGGRGPNAQLYAVTPGSAHVIGVDVGPDRVVAACADITGAIIGRVEQSTKDTDDPVGVVHSAVVQAATRAGTDMASVRRVVLGTPGLVDPKSGEISFAYDLPRWHRGLLGDLRRDLSTPVVVRQRREPGRGRRGAQRRGRGRRRLRADLDRPRRRSGHRHRRPPAPGQHRRGRRDRLAAGGRRRGAAQRLPAAASGAPSRPWSAADAVKAIGKQHGFRGAEAADVVRAAVAAGEAGEPVLDELAGRLALGVAATCVVLDPPLVVLAGEVSQAGGPALAERVEREVAAITLVSPKVVITEVAVEPVLHGALRMALDAVRDEVFGSTTG